MFGAHGLTCTVDGSVWFSHQSPPPFHSNLVVLSSTLTSQQLDAYIHDIDEAGLSGGWTMKDSYGGFDLTAHGFGELFRASWIWREPGPCAAEAADPRIAWFRVTTPEDLVDWEAAWRGDAGNLSAAYSPRQFPPSLLASPDHAFLAGRREGAVVAGGIANCSPGVAGLSNVFCLDVAANETWTGLIRLAAL